MKTILTILALCYFSSHATEPEKEKKDTLTVIFYPLNSTKADTIKFVKPIPRK